jgi:hypothetical protein
MLRDIVEEAILKQSDMELIADALELSSTPDVAVVGTTEPEESSDATTLLAQWPRSRILMIAIGGHDAVMYELRPHKTRLGEMSPARLIDAIRGTAADGELRG